MNQSKLDQAGRFRFADYQQRKPFASFLPGIAGPLGIPMWAFYVNRGQAMASFGIESKDSPILEFQPANKAYQVTPYTGFRTFLKLTRGTHTGFYEPFMRPAAGEAEPVQQQMFIGANELEIEETNPAQQLKTNVLYFTLPGDSYAGLVRRVTLQNLGSTPLALELLDGLPALVPYGVNNGLLKDMGRTLEAWMQVLNHETYVPFYGLSASVIDKAEVETYQAGHFALAVTGEKLLPALVDPAVVFESDTSFFSPLGFQQQSLSALLGARQVTCGRTPCAFFAHQATLAPGEALTFTSLYGHIAGEEVLQRHLPRILAPGYFESKYREAAALAEDITGLVETHSAHPLFDAYCRQNFLDNVLRGGLPVLLGSEDQPHVYAIYSRKHGDLERDYNAYFIAPEPYSQGEVSYRDVNQNRRDNVLQNPRVGDTDIRTFFSLIQSDGYNPRVIKGSVFTLSPQKQAEIMAGLPDGDKLASLLAKPFTPGKLLRAVADNAVQLPVAPEVFLSQVLCEAEQHLEASFFEGFWIDHWEYNLDLIESYLAVYPDRQANLLFCGPGLPFYESPVSVQPRSKKYVLSSGLPRQIGSLLEDKEKAALIASRTAQPNWMRTRHGAGEVYQASLFAKMALTVLLKFASLDPLGMGIEMEASRPGWYDALNGLPALFGSGMAETYELQRWLTFLRQVTQSHAAEAHTAVSAVRLPVEAADLLHEVMHQLSAYQQSTHEQRDFRYWDAISSARETYRERTRFGVDGAETEISLAELDACLAAFTEKVAAGITRALEYCGGLPPTYFTYSVDDYEVLPECDAQGRPFIIARHFNPQALPLFLEGPTRAMKIQPDSQAAQQLYQQVKNSPLFDAKLQMYKVNASLKDQPYEIGRARAFPSGWLENESIWLHMEYKYLLEVLKAGLYDAFYADFRHVLVPFLDEAQYGRSLLENSSFLASSAHPDASLHGAGFVARLSGSTAEFQSMWNIMMAGKQPFRLQGDQLCLELQPALPGWLFDQAGKLSFRFLGACTVTYHNPGRQDTYAPGCRVRQTALIAADGSVIQQAGGSIGAPYAEQVRAGKISRIDVFFE